MELILLLSLFLTLVWAQAPQDPLKDFCRRYGHQTAVIDRKLYIDGGWVYANPLLENPVPTINQGLLYSDLNVLNVDMPSQYANLSKNNSVPDVAGGVLWADEVNKVFWLYGGQFSAAPSKFQLWGYDVLMNQWNLSSTATSSLSSIQRVSYGAGTTLGGQGYYYGGYLNNLTNPLWNGPPLATSTLVMFDMDANTLSNNTGPDNIGRAEGVMVSIPASARGMLVYFGGVTFPYGNSTEVAMSMSKILLYDVGDAKWYTQVTTGNIPANRRKFCAGAAWADDQSSYNIYLYGGYGFGENVTGFDDVYILSLPTFEWIKWYPEKPGASNPHGLLSCNVISNAQMIIMGGNATNSSDCDVPDYGGQHVLNLGQVNPTSAKWYQFLPNLTDYSVPPDIITIAGGSNTGGATNLSPPGGFDDPALSVYFGQKAQLPSRTPTRYITKQTGAPGTVSSKTGNGAIIGGSVGGGVFLIILAIVTWFCIRKRRSGRTQQRPEERHYSSSVVNELRGDSHHENKSPMTHQVHSPHSQHSTPYSTPPPVQPTPQYPFQYQYPAQAPQQYHHPNMQQPYQGFHETMYPPMSGSSPDAIYQQQPYFPPPDFRRTSPGVAHEMPISRTPGLSYMDYQSTTNRTSTRGSVSDHEKLAHVSGTPTHRS